MVSTVSASMRILCVLLAIGLVAGHGGPGSYLDEPRLRAAMAKERTIHTAKPREGATDWRAVAEELDTKSHDIFTLVGKLARGSTGVVRHALAPLFERVENGRALLEDMIRALEQEEEEEDDRLSCTICVPVALALKTAALAIPWEDMRDPVYFICIHAAPLLVPSIRADVLCAGTIDSQGPVVHAMLISSPLTLPRRHCEFHNACFPPREEPVPANFARLPSGPQMSPAARRRASRHKRRSLESAIRVVQLADMHIEPLYSMGTSTDCGLPVCCLDTWGAGDAGRWGDYNCNVPEKTMDLFLRKARELDPHFMIYSGDSPPHTIWYETEESQFNCTRKVVAALQRELPGVRVLPNIGNHEMYPTNIYYMDMDETLRANDMFVAEWGLVANFTQQDVDTMQASAYFGTRVAPGLIALSWNTNYMYTWNWFNIETDGLVDVPVGRNYMRAMERFMDDTMSHARANGDKVLLIGHHPTGGGDIIVMNSRWLTDFIVRNKDIIVLNVAGHTHSDHFRMFRDPATGEPASVLNVVPAVDTGSIRNPSVRIFYLDNTDYTVLDYEHYYLDIERALNVEDPDIEFAYRATEEFGLPDLSAQSWWDFLGRMKEDYGLFMTFYNHLQTRSPRGQSCPQDTCMVETLCQLANSNYDEWLDCVEENTPDPPSTTATMPTTTMDGGGAARPLVSIVLTVMSSVMLYTCM